MSVRPHSRIARAGSSVLEQVEKRCYFDATLTPSADTYVRDGSFANNVYGEYALLQAKQGAAGVQRQIYTKFDIGPVTESVTNATFRVYGKRSNTTDPSFSIAVKELADSSWTEAATNWNNKPAAGNTIGTASVPNTASAWADIDITPYVQAAKAANQTYVSLAITGAANTDGYYEMSSVEGANPPQLVLLTQAAPAAPSGLSAAATSATSVNLTWSDNATNETGYIIERKSGTGAWTTLTGQTLSAGTVAFTDTTAQPGTAYVYRVYATGVVTSGYSNEAAVATPTNAVQTLSPTEDTYVRGGSFASTNYDNDPELQTKLAVGTYNREAFLRFDVPAAATNVSDVTLRVYGRRNTMVDGSNLAFAIKPVSSTTWDESTMTFNNKPSIGSTTLATINVTSISYAWFDIDLTAHVQQRLAAGGNAISLAVVGAVNNSDAYFTFVSSEDPSGNGPKLVVTSSTNAPATVLISPSDVTLPLNGSLPFTATVLDQFGQPIANPVVTWQKVSGPGSLTGSTFNASTVTGTATIRATSGTASGAATVTIANAAPLLTGDSYYTTSSTSASLSVLGTDDAGESPLTYTWAVIETPAGAANPSFSTNGTNAAKQTVATFGKAGYYELSVTASDGSLSDAMSVSVNVEQTAGTLTITPSGADLDFGATRQFEASAEDQFGDAIEDAAVTWTADSGAIDADGLYTASGSTEEDTVHAAMGGQTADATINLTLPAPGGPSATAANEKEVNVTWTYHSTGETGFVIEQSTDGQPFTAALTTPPNATGWSITGLASETDYDFRIRAVRGGVEAVSSVATVETPSDENEDWVTVSSVNTSGSQSPGPVQTFSGSIDPNYEYRIAYASGGVQIGKQGADWVYRACGLPFVDGVALSPMLDGLSVPFPKSISDLESILLATQALTRNLGPGTMNSIGIQYWDDYWSDNGSGTITWELQRRPFAPPLPTVSITATDAEAWEVPLGEDQDDQLAFTVTRSGSEENGDFDEPLTVDLHPPAGLALAADYSAVPSTVTIPSGEASTVITITAAPDELLEIQEYLSLCLKADSAYRLAGPTTQGSIGDTSIDIDVDSNNDGTISPVNQFVGLDDPIEDTQARPGKYVDITNTDSDGDFIPDFADGFAIPGKLSAHNTSAADFTPLQLTFPAGADLATTKVSLTYLHSDPMAVVIPANETTAAEWEYQPAPGNLRIWLKDGNAQRSREYVENGGDFVYSAYEYSLTDLGAVAGQSSISLYIEAVRPTDVYGSNVPITAEMVIAGVAVNPTDLVYVTPAYNPDGWRVVARTEAGFDLKKWNTSAGYSINRDQVKKFYEYYESIYTHDYASNGNGATLGPMQWAGLAKTAGQSVVFTLDTMSNPHGYLASLAGVPAQQLAGVSTTLMNFAGKFPTFMSGNLPANLQMVQVRFMEMAFDIFNDVGWQLCAYRDGGLEEMKRFGDTPDLPGPKAAAQGVLVDLVQAWSLIDSDNPASVWSGNLILANHEQNIVLAPHYSILRGQPGNPVWMIAPSLNSFPYFFSRGLTVSEALTLGTVLKAPFPGAPTMVAWNIGLLQYNSLTVDADRWRYVGGELWSNWKNKNQAGRLGIITQPLP